MNEPQPAIPAELWMLWDPERPGWTYENISDPPVKGWLTFATQAEAQEVADYLNDAGICRVIPVKVK